MAFSNDAAKSGKGSLEDYQQHAAEHPCTYMVLL
jgi:hypothetical protein